MKSRKGHEYDRLDPMIGSDSSSFENDSTYPQQPLPNIQLNTPKHSKDKKSEHSLVIPFLWDGYDTFFALFLFFFGTFSRFWVIHQPVEYMLFEQTTLAHIHCYINGTFFVSYNPPLQEYILARTSNIMEYEKNYELKENYSFSDTVYSSIRGISAFFSMMAVPIIYLILRSFGCKQFFAFCGGFFALFDPSLITSARGISIVGGVQFYCSCSLLCAAISHHFTYLSPQQCSLSFLQGLFASFAFSSSFLSFPFVLFAALWPYFRFNSKKQMFTNIGLIIGVFYLSCLMHILYTPIVTKGSDAQQMHSSFLSFGSSNYKQIEIKHFFYAFNYLMVLLKNWCIGSFKRLNAGKIGRRLIMLEKWHSLFNKDGRYVECFTNRFVTFPAAVFAYIEICTVIIKKVNRFDAKGFLCLLFVAMMVWNAFSFHPPRAGCSESYLSEYLAVAVFVTFIEQHFSQKIAGMVLTTAVLASLLTFLDWAPVVYAYFGPNPLLKPHIHN